MLRDLFAYILPGAIFVGALYQAKSDVIQPVLVHAPPWLTVVIILLACYVVGNALMALAFYSYDAIDKLLRSRNRETIFTSSAASDADLLYYRYLYPSLFNDRDRRAIINLFRIGLSLALIASFWAFPLPIIPALVGILMVH